MHFLRAWRSAPFVEPARCGRTIVAGVVGAALILLSPTTGRAQCTTENNVCSGGATLQSCVSCNSNGDCSCWYQVGGQKFTCSGDNPCNCDAAAQAGAAACVGSVSGGESSTSCSVKCGGNCCASGQSCCNGSCIDKDQVCCGGGQCDSDEQCCGGSCTPKGASCCGNGTCASGELCCSDNCYPAGTVCCGAWSCTSAQQCCNDSCIPKGATCCSAGGFCTGGECAAAGECCDPSTPTYSNGVCCTAGDATCGACGDGSMAGPGCGPSNCCPTSEPTCCGDGRSCTSGSNADCPPMCLIGQTVCGSACCSLDEVCCAGSCEPAGTECCGDGTSCPPATPVCCAQGGCLAEGHQCSSGATCAPTDTNCGDGRCAPNLGVCCSDGTLAPAGTTCTGRGSYCQAGFPQYCASDGVCAPSSGVCCNDGSGTYCSQGDTCCGSGLCCGSGGTHSSSTPAPRAGSSAAAQTKVPAGETVSAGKGSSPGRKGTAPAKGSTPHGPTLDLGYRCSAAGGDLPALLMLLGMISRRRGKRRARRPILALPLIVCAVFLTTAAAARADGPGVLAQALQLYAAQQPAAAIPLFDAVAHDPSQPPEVCALADMYVGLAKARLGDRGGAQAAFAAAFTLSPRLLVPPGEAAEVNALAEQARAQAATSAPPVTPAPAPPTAAPAAPPSSGESPTPPPATAPPDEAGLKKARSSSAATEGQSSMILGVGSGAYFLPTDKYWGPELTIIAGQEKGLSRSSALFNILFGLHNAYSVGARFDIASRPRPVGFGGGIDLSLVYQPDEPSDLPPLLLQGMLNVLNVTWEWKQLQIELRAFSIGLFVRLADSLPYRLAMESTVTIAWLPAGR